MPGIEFARFKLAAPRSSLFSLALLAGLTFSWAYAGELFQLEETEPVPAYRAIGRKSQPGRLRGIAGLRSPLTEMNFSIGDTLFCHGIKCKSENHGHHCR